MMLASVIPVGRAPSATPTPSVGCSTATVLLATLAAPATLIEMSVASVSLDFPKSETRVKLHLC